MNTIMPQLSTVYTYLSFDNFCKLREYPLKIIKELHIPSYQYYFDKNNIEIVKLSSSKPDASELNHSLRSVRIFFRDMNMNSTCRDSYYVNKGTCRRYGIDKFDPVLMNIYASDEIFSNILIDSILCINMLKQEGLLRDPYYVNLDEIINKRFFNLLGYIIYEYFEEVNVSYLLNEVEINIPIKKNIEYEKRMCAIRVAIHTDKGYIPKKCIPVTKKTNKVKLKNWDRVDTLENSILKRDYDAVMFLIRDIGMIPTKGHKKLIKKYIPKLEDAIDLVF